VYRIQWLLNANELQSAVARISHWTQRWLLSANCTYGSLKGNYSRYDRHGSVRQRVLIETRMRNLLMENYSTHDKEWMCTKLRNPLLIRCVQSVKFLSSISSCWHSEKVEVCTSNLTGEDWKRISWLMQFILLLHHRCIRYIVFLKVRNAHGEVFNDIYRSIPCPWKLTISDWLNWPVFVHIRRHHE
jgi:hypothetical protein